MGRAEGWGWAGQGCVWLGWAGQVGGKFVLRTVEESPGREVDIILGGGRGSFTPAEYEVIIYFLL